MRGSKEEAFNVCQQKFDDNYVLPGYHQTLLARTERISTCIARIAFPHSQSLDL